MKDDASERLREAVETLASVALTPPEEARAEFDPAALQSFWREWPRVGAWAGAVWRLLNEDLGDAAVPPSDPDLDETGGPGG